MFQTAEKNLRHELPYQKDKSSIQTIEIPTDKKIENIKEIRTYKRRFWMLLLYVLLAILNGIMYPQYISMANVTGCYYGVSQNAVNWTAEISMITLMIFLIPALFLMKRIELKGSLILASCLTTIACALLFLTLRPDGFTFAIISSLFGSVAGVFSTGQPPFLAAKWFPSNELSRACAVGIFGNSIAVSIGFIFTPLLVSSDCNSKDEIERGKTNVAAIVTAANAVVLLLLIFTFQNKPEIPPSFAQYEVEQKTTVKETLTSILNFLKNIDFIVVLIVNGLISGIYFAFTTNANNLMIRFFPGKELEISWMTTFFSLMGIVGALISGHILDFTHRFKEVAVVYNAMSFLSAVFFSGSIYAGKLWLVFVSSGLFGFFVAGFFPIGCEYGIEVSFPESEMMSSILLLWVMQMFGFIFIQVLSALLNTFGSIASNAAMCIILLISTIISSFLSRNYKRYKKNSEEKENVAI